MALHYHTYRKRYIGEEKVQVAADPGNYYWAQSAACPNGHNFCQKHPDRYNDIGDIWLGSGDAEATSRTSVEEDTPEHTHKLRRIRNSGYPAFYYSMYIGESVCDSGHPFCDNHHGGYGGYPSNFFYEEVDTGGPSATPGGHRHRYSDNILSFQRVVTGFTACPLGHANCLAVVTDWVEVLARTQGGNYTTDYILAPEGGYIWVSDELGEETELHYIDENGNERAIEGSVTGQTGIAGYLWVAATCLHYIDENGDERSVEGTKEGITGKDGGPKWIEGSKLRYIDADGNERQIEGTVV